MPDEENYLAEGLMKCPEWGFPFRIVDVQLTVQGYLNRVGRIERRFQNNCPGIDWCKLFLRHHPELSHGFGENIKRSHAAVDSELLNGYFNNLEEALQGVPASNILNYDETNFMDDPGKSKVVVKRGSKHPELIKDTSKANTSVIIQETNLPLVHPLLKKNLIAVIQMTQNASFAVNSGPKVSVGMTGYNA
ncbi:hypothetical protein C0J52_10181 [Blattella germanica]|nr:hypothetical protein C0J52_10181 [Blattella germanica]